MSLLSHSALTLTLRTLLQAPTFALLNALAPTHIYGREAVENLKSPVLLVANHTSHLDTPVLLRAFPANLRHRVAVAASADYFFSRPWLGAGVALWFNAFPFSRTTCAGARATIERCSRLVDEGWSILLYPEGTRSTSGEMGAFKPGIGLLARELGVPVVPIYTDGLYNILPKGQSKPCYGNVAVHFGEPLTIHHTTCYRDATRHIEQAVRALSRLSDNNSLMGAEAPNHSEGRQYVFGQ